MKLKKIFIFFSILLLLITFGYSQYYADIQIFIENDGSVSINGKTNYNELLQIQNSQLYISKNKNLWTLNLTINENFDNFIYELNLPQYSQINYIKTTPTFRIANEENSIKLIGTGENRRLSIIVQYEIDNQINKSINSNYNKYRDYLYGIGILIIIIISLRLIGFRIKFKKITNRDKNNNVNNSNNFNSNLNSDNKNDINDINNNLDELNKQELNKEKQENKINYDLLTIRQKDIVKLLEKNKNKRLTQKEIEENMNIPKSSISRNIKTLEVKQIIKKEKVGQTNYISLKY